MLFGKTYFIGNRIQPLLQMKRSCAESEDETDMLEFYQKKPYRSIAYGLK